jgi:uncharacterized protein YbdZ (MbtH family)
MENADTEWIVIANLEDAFAIWAASRPMPSHWRACGVRGTRAECERFIDACDHETRAAILRQQLERAVILP